MAQYVLRVVFSRKARVKDAAAETVRAMTRTPLVSLSRRWTRRGRTSEPKRSASSSPSRCRSVAVQNRVLQQGRVAGRRLSRTLWDRRSHLLPSRNADGLARYHMVTGAGALAVDPDPPGPQQLFEAPMAERWVVTLEPAVETDRPVLAGNGHGIGGIRHHPLRPSGGRGRGPSPAHRRCAGPPGASIARAERGDGRGRRARAGAVDTHPSP